MQTVGSYEAKTHLAELLDRVAGGESITITKRGVPVAMLVPPEVKRRMTPEEAVEMMREFRRKHRLTLGGLTIKEMKEEGRKY
jgi:prevent-host-death family protein